MDNLPPEECIHALRYLARLGYTPDEVREAYRIILSEVEGSKNILSGLSFADVDKRQIFGAKVDE